MFVLQNAETKVEEAAKESPKAARLTQQSSEDNEVFGELLQKVENVIRCVSTKGIPTKTLWST